MCVASLFFAGYSSLGLVVHSSFFLTTHSCGGRSLMPPFLPYCPFLPGAQVSSPSALALPQKKSSHPLLKNIKSFNGGSGSYRSAVTVPKACKLLASWTDGTPFLIEGVQTKRKTGLNVFLVSSSAVRRALFSIGVCPHKMLCVHARHNRTSIRCRRAATTTCSIGARTEATAGI